MDTSPDDDADYEDEYPQARPPRRNSGCPACGAPVTPTKSREQWPQHIVHGQPPGGQKCGLSGRRIGYETDNYFRTFFDRNNPPGFPERGHEVTTTLEPFGDAVGLVTKLALPGSLGTLGSLAVQLVSRITKADYPRFRDELDRIAALCGWLDDDKSEETPQQ